MNKFKNLFEEELNNNYQGPMCFISKEPLEHNHLQLPCGHTFNYISLYREVKTQKINNNLRLKKYQMQCPYCRTIIDNILPYITHSEVQRIIGVNSPEKYVLKQHTCKYKFISGKFKGHLCNKQCSFNYCSEHLTIINNNNNEYELTLEKIKKYTVIKLRNICRKHKLKGFSRLKKQELINYINKELINT